MDLPESASDDHGIQDTGADDMRTKPIRVLRSATALVLIVSSITMLAACGGPEQTNTAGPAIAGRGGLDDADHWNGLPMLFPDDPSSPTDDYVVMPNTNDEDITSLAEALWTETFVTGDVGDVPHLISLQSFAKADADVVFVDLANVPGPVVNLLLSEDDKSPSAMEAELNTLFENIWDGQDQPETVGPTTEVSEISLPPTLVTGRGNTGELRALQIHVTAVAGRPTDHRLVFVEPRSTDADPSAPVTIISTSEVDDATLTNVISGLHIVDGRVHTGGAPDGFAPMGDGTSWQPDGVFPSYSVATTGPDGTVSLTLGDTGSALTVIDLGAGSISSLVASIGTLYGGQPMIVRTGPDWVFAMEGVFLFGVRDGLFMILTNPPEADTAEFNPSVTELNAVWDRITQVDRETFEAALKKGEKLMSDTTPACVTEDVECGPIQPAVTTTVFGDAADPED